MLNERALRVILTLLGLAIFGMVVVALWEWGYGGTDGPTLALAAVGIIASLALAFAAVLTLEQNRSIVKAATEEAAASRETVEEMRREREWAYKPVLVIRHGRPDDAPRSGSLADVGPEFFFVRNVGTGPALNVALCARLIGGDHRETRWLSDEIGGIAPGQEHRFIAVYGQRRDGDDPARYRWLVSDWRDADAVAVRYEDWFGTYYRSPGSLNQVAPVEWRGVIGAADQPDWLRGS